MYQQIVVSKSTIQLMLILFQQRPGQQWSTTVQLSYLEKKKKEHNKVLSYHDLTGNKRPEAKNNRFLLSFYCAQDLWGYSRLHAASFFVMWLFPSLPIYFHLIILLDNRIYTKYRNHVNEQRICDEVLNEKFLRFFFSGSVVKLANLR